MTSPWLLLPPVGFFGLTKACWPRRGEAGPSALSDSTELWFLGDTEGPLKGSSKGLQGI